MISLSMRVFQGCAAGSLDLGVDARRPFSPSHAFSRIRWHIPCIDVQRVSTEPYQEEMSLVPILHSHIAATYVGCDAKLGRPGRDGTK